MKKATTKAVRSKARKLSLAAPAVSHSESDYEKDFSKWALVQAKYLKKKDFDRLDMDHLIEEIEDLSKREKQRLASYLEILLMHMLKVEFQPSKRTKSWNLSIKESSHKVHKTLAESPSLKSKLKEICEDAYFSARLKAAMETGIDEKKFPEKSPWTLKQLFPDIEKKYLL